MYEWHQLRRKPTDGHNQPMHKRVGVLHKRIIFCKFANWMIFQRMGLVCRCDAAVQLVTHHHLRTRESFGLSELAQNTYVLNGRASNMQDGASSLDDHTAGSRNNRQAAGVKIFLVVKTHQHEFFNILAIFEDLSCIRSAHGVDSLCH